MYEGGEGQVLVCYVLLDGNNEVLLLGGDFNGLVGRRSNGF